MNQYIKKIIVDNLNVCANNIEGEENISQKCYYLGVASDIISSSLFYDPSEQIIFIEFVLNVVFNTLNKRIEEGSLEITKKIMNDIAKQIRKLSNRINDEKETYDVLEEMVLITFSTTTIGKYIQERNMIKQATIH